MSTKDPNSQSLLTEIEPYLGDLDRLTVLYDGECPFCSRYVAMVQIRKNVGSVTLLNARDHSELVAVLRRRGIDINNGMVVVWAGKVYYGSDAMHLLAMLSDDTGAFSFVNKVIFKNQTAARTIYPALVAGRRATLWGLRRSLIATDRNA